MAKEKGNDIFEAALWWAVSYTLFFNTPTKPIMEKLGLGQIDPDITVTFQLHHAYRRTNLAHI